MFLNSFLFESISLVSWYYVTLNLQVLRVRICSNAPVVVRILFSLKVRVIEVQLTFGMLKSTNGEIAVLSDTE